MFFDLLYKKKTIFTNSFRIFRQSFFKLLVFRDIFVLDLIEIFCFGLIIEINNMLNPDEINFISGVQIETE